MKNTIALLVAALSFIVASSTQAAEAEFEFYSQVAGQRLAVASDVHYAFVNGDGAKVAEGKAEGWEIKLDLVPGSYSLVLEQPSTRFSGSLEVVVAEKNATKMFKLDRTGLSLITDAHECPCSDDGHEHQCVENGGCEDGDCKCDDDCICKRIDPACDPDGVYAPQSTSTTQYGSNASSDVISNNPASSATPNLPATPEMGYAGSSMGGLGVLGLIGAVIAIAVADNNNNDHYQPAPPVSGSVFYR